jgi:hypothetical protein
MRIAQPILMLLSASMAFGQNASSLLKQLEDDAIGRAVLSAFNACQPLAPSPYGNFVPPSATLNVTASTVTVPGVNLSGPFPVSIPPRTLQATGSTVTLPGTLFLPPAPRVCPITTTGEVIGHPPQPPGKSTFALRLLVDYATYVGNGAGGGCAQASGSLNMVKQDSGNSDENLTINHAGLLCDSVGIGSARTYTATYHITGGTKKYAGASGTGSLSASFDVARTLLHLQGNVLFAK